MQQAGKAEDEKGDIKRFVSGWGKKGEMLQALSGESKGDKKNGKKVEQYDTPPSSPYVCMCIYTHMHRHRDTHTHT